MLDHLTCCGDRYRGEQKNSQQLTEEISMVKLLGFLGRPGFVGMDLLK